MACSVTVCQRRFLLANGRCPTEFSPVICCVNLAILFKASTTEVTFFKGTYSHPSDPVRELHEGETGHDKSKDIYISPPLRCHFLHAAKMLLLGDILTVVARIPF